MATAEPLTAKQITHIRAARVAKAAQDWASEVNGFDEPYFRAVLLDALGYHLESDLSDELEICLHECGLDVDGYPVDEGSGYPIVGADRVFVPVSEYEFERTVRQQAQRRAA